MSSQLYFMIYSVVTLKTASHDAYTRKEHLNQFVLMAYDHFSLSSLVIRKYSLNLFL